MFLKKLGLVLLIVGSLGVQSAPNSLYERLGGEPGLQKLVDAFAVRASTNPKVNFFRNGRFKGINVPRLKDHLVTFIGSATGGPRPYKGRSMKTSHASMGISADEFDAIIQDLELALREVSAPPTAATELVEIAKSTKSDIVAKPKKGN